MDEFVTSTLAGLASRLGRFETSLMIEVDAAGDDAYCAALANRLSAKLGREVSLGQVSRSLGTLKRLGLLISEQRYPATPQKHMRHRLVFCLTASGMAALQALKTNHRSPTQMQKQEPAYAQ